ncbi:MAG: bifunctional glutamate N-acetyltransferase/amino-acid acetyltransferase ArgJ [Actinobacteria bacterium]|nr:bifunctional glutamate N-acetyltransferase/amino-acid acetyltransferase ArgJ [Actinomycetota bacterium]
MRWPRGFAGAGVACGIKGDGRLDLGLIVAEEGVSWAGAFTANGAAASCVRHCRALLGRATRAVVVNSGNANACTGQAGSRAVTVVTEEVAREIGCLPQEVLVASTGPIGVPLPTKLLVGALPRAMGSLSGEVGPFAASILTTDTGTKTAKADLGGASITGVAKGAGMLAPNMATMLAFIVTDARIPTRPLQTIFTDAVTRTFNRVVVDGCESTNDSAFLLSSCRGERVDSDRWTRGLHDVCSDLAQQMAHDGEGATKSFRVGVAGAKDEASAVALGRAVASSALWRAAVNGADPDWGRIVAALGSVDRFLDLTALTISIGDVQLLRKGQPTGLQNDAERIMQARDFDVTCEVGAGSASARVLSADMSCDYVRINAHGST